MYSEDALPPPLDIVCRRAMLEEQVRTLIVIERMADSVNKKSKTVAYTA